MDGFPRGLHLLLPNGSPSPLKVKAMASGFGAASWSYEEREGGGRRENTGVCKRAEAALVCSQACQKGTSLLPTDVSR